MAKDVNHKSVNWLKERLFNYDSNSNQVEEETSKETNDLSSHSNENLTEDPDKKSLFSKDNHDKVSLDMIVSLENMLKDRQLIVTKNKDLEDKLLNKNELISRLKHDQLTNEQLLQEKNKEIGLLEEKLTNKQMRYDQLFDDYKDYQSTTNNEFERITNELEKEIQKYKKLKDESTHNQYQHMIKIEELEEKIRELEVQNQNYMEEYQRILVEKDQLMKTVNDFTEQMSYSFKSKVTNATPQ